MNKRKCIKCASLNITKKGKQEGIQRYYCKDCKTKFQYKTNRKAPPETEELFYSFAFHKQTLKELSKYYHIRTKEVQLLLDQYVIPQLIHIPKDIYLEVDATYFGSNKEGNRFCLIVFRDRLGGQNVWWKFCDVERERYYLEGRLTLERLGYKIKGVTSDGLPLFRRVFRGIPLQMCQVHMERIIIRGTTREPKLQAGIDLLSIGRSIYSTSPDRFRTRMNNYTLQYFHFITERTVSEITGESWYTHERLRDAFISVQNLQDYLFTYTLDDNISRNTNSIESVFGHLKTKVKVHHGLSIKRKQRLIEVLLYYGSGVFDYNKKRK